MCRQPLAPTASAHPNIPSISSLSTIYRNCRSLTMGRRSPIPSLACVRKTWMSNLRQTSRRSSAKMFSMIFSSKTKSIENRPRCSRAPPYNKTCKGSKTRITRMSARKRRTGINWDPQAKKTFKFSTVCTNKILNGRAPKNVYSFRSRKKCKNFALFNLSCLPNVIMIILLFKNGVGSPTKFGKTYSNLRKKSRSVSNAWSWSSWGTSLVNVHFSPINS